MKIVVRTDKAAFSKRAGAFQAKVARAVAQGLNEGGDKVRTQVRAAMREQTSLLRLKSVTSRSSTARAFVGQEKVGGLSPVGFIGYTMIFRRFPATKPGEFKVRVIKGRGGGVVIRMWGKDHKFARSFQMQNGALVARRGAPRIPLQGLDGPNLANEAAKGAVLKTFERLSQTLPLEAINVRLSRL